MLHLLCIVARGLHVITAAAQGRRAVQRFVQQAEGRTQASRKPHHVQWVAKLPVVGVLPVVGGRARTFQPAAQGSKVASGARQPAAPAAQGSQRRKLKLPKAASGAGRGVQLKLKPAGSTRGWEGYLRGKIRVPGLFRCRHWISPQHLEALIREIEGIKQRKKFRE